MAQTTTEKDPGSTAERTKEQAKQQAQQAKQQAEQAGGKAKDKLREQVDQRSTQAGERVEGTAQDARSVAEELRKKGKEQPAKYAEQAADRAERVGAYLKESDADRILGDVEGFARRQPWAIMAGGLALGIAASRFLKASSVKRYEASGRAADYGQTSYGRGDYGSPAPSSSPGRTGPVSPATTRPVDPMPLNPVGKPAPGFGPSAETP